MTEVSWIVFCLMLVLSDHLLQSSLADDSYENMTALMDRLLGPKSGYNPKFRPLNHQWDPVFVKADFTLVYLEEVDDVKQSFTLNGFLSLSWYDERLTWDITQFDGMSYINPDPIDIWRPRTVLLNTLGDWDVFKDNYSPLIVHADGYVWWMSGGIFKGSCGLDMRKYPFDEQTCQLLFCPMGHAERQLVFEAKEERFSFQYFVNNEEWDITETMLNITTVDMTQGYISCIQLIIKVKRRASHFVLNLILPVVMLSLLNNFVFLIPDESGEKIGYDGAVLEGIPGSDGTLIRRENMCIHPRQSITVLLAVSVFLTTVSTMIPRTSNNVPAVTVYLFVLLSLSVASVIASIATVCLRHADEDEKGYLKAQDMYSRATTKVFGLRKTLRKVDPRQNRNTTDQSDASSSHVLDLKRSHSKTTPQINRYRMVTKHINKISFVVSMSLWVVTQVAYLFYVYA